MKGLVPWPECEECGDEYNPKRKALGYRTCLACGSPKLVLPAVPVPKSNYIVATSADQLKNPYGHKGTHQQF